MNNNKSCDPFEEAIVSLAERVSRLERHAQIAERGSPKGDPIHLESRIIGGSWLNTASVVAALFGVAYILKYGFDNAWIGLRAKVILGLLAGVGFVFSVLYQREWWPSPGRRRESFRGAGQQRLDVWATVRKIGIIQIPEVGMLVRIHRSGKNPLAGHIGIIIAISSADPYGPYLVEFPDGLRFRYRASEFSVPTYPDGEQEHLADQEPEHS